ncbi:hypothetical protein DTO164E3_6614 [Paecilomyces variotii]|nr:hypothetical protein DTO164E3_6614 [Paecilomyces variotii]KAJ9361505.1 hypothetical protein DTO027B9_666 [Paecilomyces variotii]KAJ9409822.1 hypothetical protein DTO045G8_2298 [Paecilomyces variotii]
MASARSRRILARCEIIWGKGDYDIDLETDDYTTYWALVKRDFGTKFGPPLTMTGLCGSENAATRELDRMLGIWAQQVQSGQPMTDDQSLEIFGGPHGDNKWILKQFIDMLNKKEEKEKDNSASQA